MQRQLSAIHRLARKILENGGMDARALVSKIHQMLWDYSLSHKEITTTSDECPQGDENCDPPGDGRGDA